MNSFSRGSRWLAMIFYAPSLMACLALGLAFLYVGFTEVTGVFFPALVAIGAGALAVFLTVVIFRKMRQILMGDAKPWGRATGIVIVVDVLVVFLVLIAVPKIQEQRQYEADAAVRRQQRSLK
jgi:predicted Kef-type K+ transport protein